MQRKIPDWVRALPAGRLIAHPVDNRVVLYLREEDFGMRRYPPKCPTELRLAVWEMDHILVIVLLLRLARTDLTTFECWIHAGEPRGVRTLQCLADQEQVDIQIVADREQRWLRAANRVRKEAAQLVETIRGRDAWEESDFQNACARVAKLYPTSHALWWSAGTRVLPPPSGRRTRLKTVRK